MFAAVMPQTAGIRRPGAAALDLADVACGRFEAFWELTLAPWDFAAGMLLVREAGGVVTDGRVARARCRSTSIVGARRAIRDDARVARAYASQTPLARRLHSLTTVP